MNIPAHSKIVLVVSSCAKTNVSDEKTSISRLAKAEKAKFTGVNEYFSDERNEEIGVFAQTLVKDRSHKPWISN